MHVTHFLRPVYDMNSEILILGTMPSPKSREAGFFYGHPQNRFWPALSGVYGEPCGDTPEQKTAFLLRHQLALWDVLHSCDIDGASDSSIKNPVVNDFTPIFSTASIRKVCATGKTAAKLYKKLTGRSCTALPSPSPANCRFSLAELIAIYKESLL